MVAAIPDPSFEEGPIRVIMRLIRMWNNSGFRDFARCCISWVEATLDCERGVWHRYLIAGAALCALDNYPSFSEAVGSISPRDDTYVKVAIRYLGLYRQAQSLKKVDPSPARPAAAIVALQIIRLECSDVERPAPKKHILGMPLVQVLTWAVENTPKNPVHFRPLALEIFTLIGGMWFDPWVDTIPPEDKARLINALGNVLDTPNLTLKKRDPLTPWPPGSCIGSYQALFEGRTGSFVHRSTGAYLIPLLFGLCSSKAWQASLKKSTFGFISHETFRSDDWAILLRHTWKMIVRDSRLDIKLAVIKLKELECYDALALVIRSIWLSPDLGMLPPHYWEWVERETLGLFKVRKDPEWRPLEGYFPTILRAYIEPPPDDVRNPPGAAARYIFQYDGQPDGPIREQKVFARRLLTQYNRFWVEEPQHWMICQVCMIKRLCQVLAREMEAEGLQIFQKRGQGGIQGREVPHGGRSAVNMSYFVCDDPS